MGQIPGKMIASHNPFTGHLLGKFARFERGEIVTKVKAAREIASEWKKTPIEERIRCVLRLRSAILDEMDDICELVSAELGEPIAEVPLTAIYPVLESLNYYAEIAGDVLRDVRVDYRNRLKSRKVGIDRYEPFGVIGLISSWVFPFSIPMTQIIPSVIAGNAVVMKASEHAPLIGMKLEELFRKADLPENLLCVITGDDETGRELIESGVDKVLFTGRRQNARDVMRSCAERLLPIVVFPGGKGTAIVLRDAQIERAARGIAYGAFLNSGQACGRVERVFVDGRIFDDFSVRLALHVKSLKVGDPSLPHTEIGPQKTDRGIREFSEHLADALEKGAKLMAGGMADDSGPILKPTLIAGVTEEMRVFHEETLSPILGISAFSSLTEVLSKMNDNDGLHTSIWTSDTAAALEIASSIRSGTVSVNDVLFTLAEVECPWGGIGMCGSGKMHAEYGLKESCFVKHISYDSGKRRTMPWWFPYDDRYHNLVSTYLESRLSLAEFVSRWRETLRR